MAKRKVKVGNKNYDVFLSFTSELKKVFREIYIQIQTQTQIIEKLGELGCENIENMTQISKVKKEFNLTQSGIYIELLKSLQKSRFASSRKYEKKLEELYGKKQKIAIRGNRNANRLLREHRKQIKNKNVMQYGFIEGRKKTQEEARKFDWDDFLAKKKNQTDEVYAHAFIEKEIELTYMQYSVEMSYYFKALDILKSNSKYLHAKFQNEAQKYLGDNSRTA